VLDSTQWARQFSLRFQFVASLGFDLDTLSQLYASVRPKGALERAYDLLIGFDGSGTLSYAWEFEYRVSDTSNAGVIVAEISSVVDGANNQDLTVAEGVERQLSMTVVCGYGSWGQGSPCEPWSDCSADFGLYTKTNGSSTQDRVCGAITSCKGPDYWHEESLVDHFGLIEFYEPALETFLGFGVEDLNWLKGMSEDETNDWFDERSDAAGGTDASSEFSANVRSLTLQYTVQEATTTSDTVCTSVSACKPSQCKRQTDAATHTEDAQCSRPCEGHGECIDAVCTCMPTCQAWNGTESFSDTQQ
jgi:hypothetical protein